MNFLKLITFFCIITLGLPAYSAPEDVAPATQTVVESQAPSTKTMGYQEWKKNQVFDARMSLDKFKSPQLSKAQPQPQPAENKDPNVENSGDNTENSEEKQAAAPARTSEDAEKLRQLEFNLEIAQGLTIHDYFALYLKNKTKEEMAQAIRQLSPEELSELLMAYRKSLYGVPVKEAANETAVNKNL